MIDLTALISFRPSSALRTLLTTVWCRFVCARMCIVQIAKMTSSQNQRRDEWVNVNLGGEEGDGSYRLVRLVQSLGRRVPLHRPARPALRSSVGEELVFGFLAN